MRINIIITRTRRRGEILEVFSASPRTRHLDDPSRALYHAYRMTAHKKSIGDAYAMKSATESDGKIINVYEYADGPAVPRLSETVAMDYSPVMGEKACAKCHHYRRHNGRKYCVHRGIRLKFDVWRRCEHWREALREWRGNADILHQET